MNETEIKNVICPCLTEILIDIEYFYLITDIILIMGEVTESQGFASKAAASANSSQQVANSSSNNNSNSVSSGGSSGVTGQPSPQNHHQNQHQFHHPRGPNQQNNQQSQRRCPRNSPPNRSAVTVLTNLNGSSNLIMDKVSPSKKLGPPPPPGPGHGVTPQHSLNQQQDHMRQPNVGQPAESNQAKDQDAGDRSSGSHIGENGCWDISRIKEEDYEELAVYLVPDVPTQKDERNKAEGSLPRNLTLKPSGVINDVSIIYIFSNMHIFWHELHL